MVHRGQSIAAAFSGSTGCWRVAAAVCLLALLGGLLPAADRQELAGPGEPPASEPAAADGPPLPAVPLVIELLAGPPADDAPLRFEILPPDAAAGRTAGQGNQVDPPAADGFLEFEIAPPVLRLPGEDPDEQAALPPLWDDTLVLYPPLATRGFAGPSGILRTEEQTDGHFVPVEDRWRIGMPAWDRYDRGHPLGEDYPYKEGRWWDPYNQNVLKGDFPILGQHTFLSLTGKSFTQLDFRQVPTPTTPFESTGDPNQTEFFGDPEQFLGRETISLAIDLFHGDAGFKPVDWQVRVTPVFNVNRLAVRELGIVNPDVRRGKTRTRDDFALEEWWFEAKLADLSPDYDFVSLRAGSQPFIHDFRGFVFSDVNRGVRLFGTRHANRDQFNLVWFDQTEKETNSELNTFDDRHQNTVVANYFRQDFLFPGYTAELSLLYNRDQASFEFDANDFLVRPDPAGVFTPHEINAFYLGWAGDGHINRLNVSHAFYWVLGRDELNPIAGRKQDINAQMAAVELSLDRDWARFRGSLFWSSGDSDPNDGQAEGFDAVFDNPNFAGGPFSYWQRQPIGLFGVRLVNDRSLIPNLRASKIQGQTNFVNPGLLLVNLGMDADVTPKFKLVGNVNFLWFDATETLELFTFQDGIRHFIGTDMSLGAIWRPLLNDNVVLTGGLAMLVPGDGFSDLYRKFGDEDAQTHGAGFLEIALVY